METIGNILAIIGVVALWLAFAIGYILIISWLLMLAGGAVGHVFNYQFFLDAGYSFYVSVAVIIVIIKALF